MDTRDCQWEASLQKTSSPSAQEARAGHALQCHLPVSYFLMKAALQIFIIPYASYAWDTCLFRISFANYAIQTVRYDIIYMS